MILTKYEGSIDPCDVLMLVLGLEDKIIGSTRFMKYLFLIHQSKIFKKNEFIIPWKSHFYGPFWDRFDTFIYSLSNKNFLEINELTNYYGNTSKKFILTREGKSYFEHLKLNYKSELGYITQLLNTHNKKSLTLLLQFVYDNYPEFTSNSLVKEKIFDNQ